MWLMACGSSPLAPVPEGEGIIIYENLNYGGASEPLNMDIGNLESLEGPCNKTLDGGERVPIWGDCISSGTCQSRLDRNALST